MAESDLNGLIQTALAGMDPKRVENSADPGTPDINYTTGWIESKFMKSWPVRHGPLRVPHYVREQRGWHMGRRHAGGRVHVVIQVVHEVFVFDAADAAQHLGFDWNREAMVSAALLHMPRWDGRAFRNFVNRCDNDRAGR